MTLIKKLFILPVALFAAFSSANAQQARVCLLASFITLCAATHKVAAQDTYYEIKNDCFWNTTEGKPIYSQGGGIFRFPDPDTGTPTYYWYGNHYKEAEQYRENPRKKYNGTTFLSVSCYSSSDMVNWHEEADVLTAEEANGGRRRGGC